MLTCMRSGIAWSTVAARVYMATVLLAVILHHDRRHRTGLLKRPLAPDLARVRRLVGLGLPAAIQIGLEIGVFAVATALIGKLNPAALAAHQIAMNVATLAYMVPLGISAAAAVRVGQALGRGDPRAAAHSGWTAIALGAGFMTLAGLVLLLAPRLVVRIFTPDAAVMKLGVTLLAVAAAFQLFDGVQTVSTGALRGAGDTRTPSVDVSRRRMFEIVASRSDWHSTVTMTAGRFFFIWIGWNQTSAAPAANRRSWT